VLNVDRRKYRFRFLDASIARCYEFKLMSSTQGPKSAISLGYGGDELQGQYRIPDAQQCMKFVQIANDGGLLPFPLVRDSFELWPAKAARVHHRLHQVHGRHADHQGRRHLPDRHHEDGQRAEDGHIDPHLPRPELQGAGAEVRDRRPRSGQQRDPGADKLLRPLPNLPANWKNLLDNRMIFEVQRGSAGGEMEWLVNGKVFDPPMVATSMKNRAGNSPLAQQKKNSFNLWEIRNGGGGWIHPFHLHMEEHRVVMRNGQDVVGSSPGHPDDIGREGPGQPRPE
jgi:FtsP/CotA-like multicopper oxidase with cupredoxin domain